MYLRARVGAAILVVNSLQAADAVSFVRQVRPILADRCFACHNRSNASGKFSVESVSSLVAGGASGKAVQPGRPDVSLLIRTISGDKPRMPKVGAPLREDQVATLRLWIEQGARDDSGGKGEKQEPWWSLRP